MPALSRLSTRDSGNPTGLTTQAIIGLSCGAVAVALFLLSIVLFVIYWRRQHRYDLEDMRLRQRARWSADWDRWEEPWAETSSSPTPQQYTMDYKADIERVESRGTGSTLRGEPLGGADQLPPGGMSAATSSMPTHPAYIPRAMVRGVTPTTHSSNPSRSPDPFPLASIPSRGTRPHAVYSSTQAYLDVTVGAAAAALQLQEPPRRENSSAEVSPVTYTSTSGSVTSTRATSIPPRAGSESFPMQVTRPRRLSNTSGSPVGSHQQGPPIRNGRSRSRSQSQTRERPSPINGSIYPPGQLFHQAQQPQRTQPPLLAQPAQPKHQAQGRNERPLSGREDITISGPLAFKDSSNAAGDRRTFRERSESATRRLSQRLRGQPSESHRGADQSVVYQPPPREVTIESDDSDLYG